MKILAKYNVCNHCVIGEKTFGNSVYLSDPISYRDFRERGPRSVQLKRCEQELTDLEIFAPPNTRISFKIAKCDMS